MLADEDNANVIGDRYVYNFAALRKTNIDIDDKSRAHISRG